MRILFAALFFSAIAAAQPVPQGFIRGRQNVWTDTNTGITFNSVAPFTNYASLTILLPGVTTYGVNVASKHWAPMRLVGICPDIGVNSVICTGLEVYSGSQRASGFTIGVYSVSGAYASGQLIFNGNFNAVDTTTKNPNDPGAVSYPSPIVEGMEVDMGLKDPGSCTVLCANYMGASLPGTIYEPGYFIFMTKSNSFMPSSFNFQGTGVNDVTPLVSGASGYTGSFGYNYGMTWRTQAGTDTFSWTNWCNSVVSKQCFSGNDLVIQSDTTKGVTNGSVTWSNSLLAANGNARVQILGTVSGGPCTASSSPSQFSVSSIADANSPTFSGSLGTAGGRCNYVVWVEPSVSAAASVRLTLPADSTTSANLSGDVIRRVATDYGSAAAINNPSNTHTPGDTTYWTVTAVVPNHIMIGGSDGSVDQAFAFPAMNGGFNSPGVDGSFATHDDAGTYRQVYIGGINATKGAINALGFDINASGTLDAGLEVYSKLSGTKTKLDFFDKNGNLSLLGRLLQNSAPTSINNAAGVTLTGAQMTSGYIIRTGNAAVTDNTPTAQDIIAAMGLVAPNNNVNVGSGFPLYYINGGTGNVTFHPDATGGASGTVTFAPAGDWTIAHAPTTIQATCYATNITAGSLAVTCLRLQSVAQ